MKSLNKIFCFSNIILVWKERTVEFPETVTMDVFLFFEIEIATGEWSVDKVAKKSARVIASWRLFETNLRCIKPEAYFCPKVNCFVSGFLSLHISHRSKCSYILINFATDFFFRQGEPPSASKAVSRNRLKSSASIICLFWWMSKLSKRRWRLVKTLICSVSVFAMYILAKM